MEQEPISNAKPQEPHDNAPLFVSLYIVMLAFFIMLNTIAKHDEEKMRAATESVAQAFAIKNVEDIPEMFSDAGTELSATQFFSEMKALAASFVPVEKLAIYSAGNSMEIVLPQDYVFVPEKTDLHPLNEPFFERISEALSRWQEGLRIEMEVLIAMPRGTVQLIERENDNRLPIGRASELEAYFERHKVNPKSIVPGIAYDGSGTITLRFNVRESGRARLNLTQPQ